MLNTVFYCVVNMSITAAIIGTAVLLVRGILGRRLPKLAVYILWSLVLFRMLIPFSFGAPWSFIKSLSSITGYSVKVVIVQTPVRDLAGLSAMNHIQEASDYYPVEYKSTSISENFKLAAWIWFCGVLACGLLTTALYSFTIHRLKRAVLLKDEEGILKSCKSRLKVKACSQIYTCKMVDSPLVLGIIRPRIIIPEGIDKGSLQYILLHELVHIKRKDNLWRLMATAAACIHWFNPLTWGFLVLSSADAELACDSKVLSLMDTEQRKEYGRLLAEQAIKQHIPMAAFGGTAVRQRISNVLSYRKVSLFMVAATLILCILLVMLLVTNPV